MPNKDHALSEIEYEALANLRYRIRKFRQFSGKAAEKLGLKNVNTFVGRDWTKSVDDNWPRFLKTWRPLIAFAEDHGIKIGIENCPMLFTNDEWPGGKNLAMCPAIWRRMSQVPA